MISVFIRDMVSCLILNSVRNMHTWMIETMFTSMESETIPSQSLKWTLENDHACLSLSWSKHLQKRMNGDDARIRTQQYFFFFRSWLNSIKNRWQTKQNNQGILFRSIVFSKERKKDRQSSITSSNKSYPTSRTDRFSYFFIFVFVGLRSNSAKDSSRKERSYLARMRVSMIFRLWNDLNRSWRMFPSV